MAEKEGLDMNDQRWSDEMFRDICVASALQRGVSMAYWVEWSKDQCVREAFDIAEACVRERRAREQLKEKE